MRYYYTLFEKHLIINNSHYPRKKEGKDHHCSSILANFIISGYSIIMRSFGPELMIKIQTFMNDASNKVQGIDTYDICE